MKIVYASDDNYFTYVAVSVKTLLESNACSQLAICYIYQDVTDEHLQILHDMGLAYGVQIETRPLEGFPVLDELPAFATSKTTWAKFFFASMFPDDERVLFLDPDTLILDDISSMFSVDMGSNLIAGVPECLPKYHRIASKLTEEDTYINGGVVLCNLEQWRAEEFEARAIERLHAVTNNLNFDQGVINELCKGRVMRLNARYCVLAEMFYLRSVRKLRQRFGFANYYTQKELDESIENPAIVHFTGFLYLKPYSKNCTHPYASVFWHEVRRLPLGFVPDNSVLNMKQRFRKYVLDRLPYPCFLLTELILDIRRRYKLNKD